VYKENIKGVYSHTADNVKAGDDELSKFYESIQILNMDPNELKQFVDIGNGPKGEERSRIYTNT